MCSMSLYSRPRETSFAANPDGADNRYSAPRKRMCLDLDFNETFLQALRNVETDGDNRRLRGGHSHKTVALDRRNKEEAGYRNAPARDYTRRRYIAGRRAAARCVATNHSGDCRTIPKDNRPARRRGISSSAGTRTSF